MRKYLTILLLPLMAACTSKGPKEAIIAGSLPNFTDSIALLNGKGLSDTIHLNADKTFTYKVMLNKPTLYTFRAYRTQVPVYLIPGETVNVDIDFSNLSEGPKFSGSLVKTNQYLLERSKSLRTIIGNWQDLYGAEVDQFNLKLDTIKGKLTDMLDSIKNESEEILNLEKARVDYYIQYLKANYPEYNAEILGEEFNSDSADYSMFNDFNPNKCCHLMFDEYSNLVNKYISLKLSKEVNLNEFYEKPAIERLSKLFAVIDTNISNPEIRDYLKHNDLVEEIQFGKFYELSDEVNAFVEKCQTVGYKNKVNAIFTKKMQLAPGKPAPLFKEKDIDGKEVSLENLKGNLVYVDFWATWCGPCKYELPYLAKLEKEYHGKKIVFVSMSVDDDFSAWENKVKNEKLQGVQLHAEGAWASVPATSYQVKAIPTFFLIDGNGMIILPNAPRPSSEEIRQLIDENLKKL